MIDELKKIPDKKLKLVEDLQFSNKEVTVDKTIKYCGNSRTKFRRSYCKFQATSR